MRHGSAADRESGFPSVSYVSRGRDTQRLTKNGVDWWSLKEEYLRSVGVFRDAVLSILATVAKQERIRLSERVKAGMERARAEGKNLGRPQVIVDRDKVLELRRQGLAFWEIGNRLGISKSSVGRILEEYPEIGRAHV